MYGVIVTIHILLAGIWLTNILIQLIMKPARVSEEKSKTALYLQYTNLAGMIGAIGILLTGIYLVISNPAYNFFQFNANHWLTSKQIVMVAILIIVAVVVIPTGKKIRASIDGNDAGIAGVLFAKLDKYGWVINVLVVLNILFALSRRFM
ncbi:MAG: hypothetical protein JW995_05335 [Melioribacteraceae bacterium]|nr:hypothetical protein [Melioribacteraceae bacterium]